MSEDKRPWYQPGPMSGTLGGSIWGGGELPRWFYRMILYVYGGLLLVVVVAFIGWFP